MRAVLSIFLVLLPLAAACGDDESRVCNVDADCASLDCRPDGTCAPLGGDDGGTETDGGATDGGESGPDGGPVTDGGGEGSDAALPGCVPNHDGVIERSEVPLSAGLRATFRVASDVTVSTAGMDLGGGRRRWDLSGDLTGDRTVLVETRDPSGEWFAEDFPSATYATELTDGSDLLGVFEITPSELALLGVVSPDDGFTATNLSHDPPVTTLRFPLEMGASWSTDATVSGTNLGVISAWSEDYTQEVDAAGELLTPFGTFEVLRVKVVLERTVGILTTTVRTFLFVSECFGTVASVTSNDDERREEFTDAAEVRRLTP